jgi:hypothetical protein
LAVLLLVRGRHCLPLFNVQEGSDEDEEDVGRHRKKEAAVKEKAVVKEKKPKAVKAVKKKKRSANDVRLSIARCASWKASRWATASCCFQQWLSERRSLPSVPFTATDLARADEQFFLLQDERGGRKRLRGSAFIDDIAGKPNRLAAVQQLK